MQKQIQILKIVSGGQTGVDRGALDAAIFLQIEHGGWCPKGRLAEDGIVPERYDLCETESRKYPVRTEQNVIDSDGTLILYFQTMRGGTLLTKRMARKHRRPLLCVDLAAEANTNHVHDWIDQNVINILNVAGPRESSARGIANLSRMFILSLLDSNHQTENNV